MSMVFSKSTEYNPTPGGKENRRPLLGVYSTQLAGRGEEQIGCFDGEQRRQNPLQNYLLSPWRIGIADLNAEVG